MASNSAGIGGLLPPQTTDVASYILTTDGQTASWEASSASLPSQGGNSGKYLTTNGTVASWASVVALPDQTGNNGKFLTTNGTTASWAAGIGGVTTMQAVGAVPNANAGSISGADLTLQPADGSFPGVVTTAAQTFAGLKTFNDGCFASPNVKIFETAAGLGPGIVLSSFCYLASSGGGATMAINANNTLNVQMGGNTKLFFDSGTPTIADFTGLGVGGGFKLKSPDGTVYTCTIANGGTWSIV